MGLCSCKAECNCGLSTTDPDNGLLFITGDGNPDTGGWKLQVNETPWDGTGDGAIQITEDGAYGHSPSFELVTEDTGTLALEVTANGLRGEVIGVGSAGGGTPTGVVEDYLGDVAPAGYVMASGPNYAGYIDILDAPGIFALVGHSASGGVDPMDGTFLVPYLGERFLIGAGGPYLVDGVPGGEATVALDITKIPAHNHPAALAGVATAATSITPAPDHTHNGAGANLDFIVEDPTPAGGFKYLDVVATNVDTLNTMRFTSNGTGGGLASLPNREQNTAPDGGHGHAAATTVDVSGMSVSTSNAGSGVAPTHNNIPPYFTVNRIIKM